MKTTLLFLFILTCFSALSQDDVTITISEDSSLKDGVYMLDSAGFYRRNYDFTLDSKDGFLQVYKEYAVITYMLRGDQQILSGKMINSRIIELDGILIHAFTVVTDNKYTGVASGKRCFFGISYEGSKPTVYELDVYNIPTRVFSSHMASEEEIKFVKQLK